MYLLRMINKNIPGSIQFPGSWVQGANPDQLWEVPVAMGLTKAHARGYGLGPSCGQVYGYACMVLLFFK